MPRFTYTGEAGLYYPYLAGGLAPEPGSEHELEAAPVDGRWTDADGVVVREAEVAPVDPPAAPVVTDPPTVLDPPVVVDEVPDPPVVVDEVPTKSTRGGK